MGRPLNADAAATKRRILESASELLVSGGPDALTARAVARRAEVSPALVHHHFIDLKGLVDVVIETLYERIHEIGFDLVAALGRGESLDSVLERGVRELFRHALDHQPYVRLMLTTVIRAGELDAARSEQTQSPLLSAASSALAQRLGLRPEQVRMRLRSMVSLVSRYAVFNDTEMRRLISDEAVEPIEAIEQHLVNVIKLLLS